MEKTRRTRRTFSSTQKHALLAEWHESGQTAYAFGKACGIGAGSLTRWDEEQRDYALPKGEAKMSFLPIEVEQEPTTTDHDVVAQIVVGGLAVQIFAGAQQADVRQLMQAALAVHS